MVTSVAEWLNSERPIHKNRSLVVCMGITRLLDEVYVEDAVACNAEQPVVYGAYDAEQQDAADGNHEAEALGECRAESFDLTRLFADIHCLDHQKIVVQGNDGVDEGDEHQYVDCNAALVDGCGEDEEFAEEACEGRDAGEGEHGQHHCKRQSGIGLGQSAVVINGYLAGEVLDGGDDAEGCEVGEDVYQNVIHHCGGAHDVVGDDAEHNVSGLRYGRECQEALDVALAYGKEVAYGDGQDDECVQHPFPNLAVDVAESLCKHAHEGESCRAFGYDAEVGGDRSGSSLIYIGRPEVEGHE